MWKTHRPPADIQELPVQDCKQPRLDLAAMLQLVGFGRPDIECLLGKIARVGLRACQAESESVKRFIMLGHNLFKIICRHKAVPVEFHRLSFVYCFGLRRIPDSWASSVVSQSDFCTRHATSC